jgi:hypothetical protein
VENSVWWRLWTSRKTEHRMKSVSAWKSVMAQKRFHLFQFGQSIVKVTLFFHWNFLDQCMWSKGTLRTNILGACSVFRSQLMSASALMMWMHSRSLNHWLLTQVWCSWFAQNISTFIFHGKGKKVFHYKPEVAVWVLGG